VPSYTPPPNRGGDRVLLVAFGYPKEREKRIKNEPKKAHSDIPARGNRNGLLIFCLRR
jgi:hypothetical protein